ncbi:phenazine biosynthesis protein PhzF [Vibrio navarrensis]|uniref:PhzF family phenazine biosynthesis protein n=1 Tax=Vibrio navarrensis TaxID=29495 RepID=A0AAJ4I8P7_9VIBR|nr:MULTISPECIES: PhzF family phenazine biosynthesis protein [Vibrio]MBE3662198.1 phenazine biosynthesis protein PhzF [Vibrio navarrensis]MBE4603157.1 phenazine biosynthesis protein PhzF [Vibrio navarrensis]QPL52394.1 PhzF family phenazine biosynthesis protein [Vibrio navarrensis]
MEVDIYQVDAFTSELFKGNPAGVCITAQALDESLMLAIAREMAVSETAFLSLDTMNLRWFTPEIEVRLCGHGTLATAHILKEQGQYAQGETIEFHTLSGILTAELDRDAIHLSLPTPMLEMGTELRDDFLEALGIDASEVLDFATFDSKQLLILDEASKVTELTPDFSRLLTLKGRGIVVSARADDDIDFISRYFAPWVGVNEDPVTGSAHCALGVYWSRKLAKTRMKAYQASPRGGLVDVELIDPEMVRLSGQAVTTLRGRMMVKLSPEDE